jgi:hypothetical protein
MYADPDTATGESEWTKLRVAHAAHPKVPMIQVANFPMLETDPVDGGPGDELKATRFTKISQADLAGITVIGHVDLRTGRNQLRAVPRRDTYGRSTPSSWTSTTGSGGTRPDRLLENRSWHLIPVSGFMRSY